MTKAIDDRLAECLGLITAAESLLCALRSEVEKIAKLPSDVAEPNAPLTSIPEPDYGLGEFLSWTRREGIVVHEPRAPMSACWPVIRLYKEAYCHHMRTIDSTGKTHLNRSEFKREMLKLGFPVGHSNGMRFAGLVQSTKVQDAKGWAS